MEAVSRNIGGCFQKIMKRIIYLAVFLSVAAAPGWSSPLQRELVAPDAKWLLHVDLENFRQTKLGTFVVHEVMEQALKEVKTNLKFDAVHVFSKLKSVTAYGSDYEMGKEAKGVVVVKTDVETRKALEGLLVAQILQNTNGPIRKVQNEPFTVYTMNNDIFASAHEGILLLGKSRSQLERTHEIIAGKTRGLKNGKAFSDFPETPNGFFFLAVAESFGQNQNIPPQARILQMADGARIVLGERADNLFLNLALKGKTAAVTKEIQQVIEGMVALVSLGQSENKELMQLVKSTRVSGADRIVNLALEFPIADAIQKVRAEANKKAAKTGAKKRHRNDLEKAEATPPTNAQGKND